MPSLDLRPLALLALLAGFATPLCAQDSATDSVKSSTVLREVAVVGAKAVAAREGSAATGYRVDTLGNVGPLRGLEMQKAPYSVHAVSKDEIETREAHTSADVFKTNPTMAVLMSSNTFCSMSRLQSRGFSAADQSVSRDGLVDRGFTYEPVENVEQAEALNGLSSFFNGFATIGGSLNYVTKQPTDTAYRAVSGGIYGGGIAYLHGDFGGPVDSAGRLGYRFGAYHEEGNTFVEDGKQQRNLLYGSLRYRLSDRTTIGTNAYYQHFFVQGLSNYYLPTKASGVPDPDAFDPTVQYGQKWTYDESDKILASVKLESRLSDLFTLRAAYQYGDMYREYNRVNLTLTDAVGSYAEEYTGTPRQLEQTRSYYALVDAKFLTGPVGHALTFGYTGTYFEYYRGPDTIVVLGASSLSKPAYFAIPVYPTKLNSGTFSYYDNAYIGDRAVWGIAQLVAGVNYAQIRSKSWVLPNDTIQKNTLGATQSAWTPSIALTLTPIDPLSVYASYMEGLATGGTAGTTFKNPNLENKSCPVKNAREMLDPSHSRQGEAGIKGSLFGLNVTLAAYYLSQVNEYVDPSDSIYKQDGRVESKGVELVAQGRILSSLAVGGGFSVQDVSYAQVASTPSYEGEQLVNVPESQARVFLEYSLPWLPLHLSGGANYYGRRAINVPNTMWISDATTLDAGLRFDPVVGGHRTSVQLNVANLLDERFWANYRSGEGLEVAAPRTFSASVKVEI
jgi:iron complex outermembrane recepter protein